MPYCDAFVLPLKKDQVEAYKKFAALGETVWREHGAIDYREFIADDVKPGEHTSFPQAVKLEDDEVVVFSYALYESREARDACVAKVMADPRMDETAMKDMPIDGKRMFWGGFKPLVPAT